LVRQTRDTSEAKDNGGDKEGANFQAVGSFDNVDQSGVDKNERGQAEANTPYSMSPCQTERVTATAAEVIRTSTPVAYAPPLRVHVCTERVSVNTNPIAE